MESVPRVLRLSLPTLLRGRRSGGSYKTWVSIMCWSRQSRKAKVLRRDWTSFVDTEMAPLVHCSLVVSYGSIEPCYKSWIIYDLHFQVYSPQVGGLGNIHTVWWDSYLHQRDGCSCWCDDLLWFMYMKLWNLTIILCYGFLCPLSTLVSSHQQLYISRVKGDSLLHSVHTAWLAGYSASVWLWTCHSKLHMCNWVTFSVTVTITLFPQFGLIVSCKTTMPVSPCPISWEEKRTLLTMKCACQASWGISYETVKLC